MIELSAMLMTITSDIFEDDQPLETYSDDLFEVLSIEPIKTPMQYLNMMPEDERQEFRDAITRQIDAHNGKGE